METSRDDERPRRPVAEPEIIPPDRADPRWRGPDRGPDRGAEQVWLRQRIHVAQPGPLGLALGLLAVGALAAVGIVAFLGIFLLLIPVVGAMVAALVLAALLRGPRRR